MATETVGTKRRAPRTGIGWHLSVEGLAFPSQECAGSRVPHVPTWTPEQLRSHKRHKWKKEAVASQPEAQSGFFELATRMTFWPLR